MKRILVVDDDRNMVKTLCDVLRLHGWETEGAYSGEEAIESVRQKPYSAVLMDIKMPGMDGVQALKLMRQERPDLRVLLMTAHATRDLILEAEREGAIRILPKPMGLDGLLQSLERTLRRSRSVLIGLRAKGFVTVEARSLDAALKRLQAEAPAAVLLHLRVDGLEPKDSVLAIRQVSPAVALILYSGHIPTLDLTETALPREWVFARLQKPFAVERLTALLDELLAAS
jgi:two-component system, NtrC family, response regulator HydG